MSDSKPSTLLTNKTAVVIGGGGGVGRGVCLGLSAEGMKVVVADLDADAAAAIANEIAIRSGDAIALHVDSTKSESLEVAAAKTIKKYGTIDVLVSTVGVILESPLEDIAENEWDWIWSLNVMAQVRAVNTFLPRLRSSSNAHILLTASGAGFIAPDRALKIGAYSTTKHALLGYAKNLRSELAAEGIQVSLLCPSGVVGNLAETSAKSHHQALGDESRETGGRQPTGRTLEGNDIMGDVAVRLLKTGAFLGSNKQTAIVEAVKSEFSSLLG